MSLNTLAPKFLADPDTMNTLSRLYGRGAVSAQKERYANLAACHVSLFGEKNGLRFVSAPAAPRWPATIPTTTAAACWPPP